MSSGWVFNAAESMRAAAMALDAQSRSNVSASGAEVPLAMGATLVQAKSVYKSVNSGMNRGLSSMMALGLLTDEGNDALNAVYKAMLVSEAVFAMYSTYRGIVAATTAVETVLAAAEVTLHTVALDWGSIALAGAAAAAVFVGFEYASGNWDMPAVNISSATDRRKAARQLGANAGGG